MYQLLWETERTDLRVMEYRYPLFDRGERDLKTLSFFGFSISQALYGYTCFTINGPLHLDLSFLGNKWSQEL